MAIEEYKEGSALLKDVADRIVGRSFSDPSGCVAHEEFVIVSKGFAKLFNEWCSLLNGLISVSRYTFFGRASDNRVGARVSLFWRAPPEVKYDDVKEEYVVYSRFKVKTGE